MAIVAALFSLFIIFRDEIEEIVFRTPNIQVESSGKLSSTNSEPFLLDVTLSNMPEKQLFPAASLSITFDSSKLEFLGIEEGNILILGDENASGSNLALPMWEVNTEYSNKTGKINILYLDSTGGRYSFSSQGFEKDKQDVLVRLSFKLRGSALPGDIYDLVIVDGVLAASDSEKSLAVVKGTLKTIDGRIVVGE
ncbi:cohesin domain-containing protein [Alloiococcus sp. CFN-8]|uniref:cohesin domain-containing protein n=1 Tax=Alloiococcus sp. CFN-8 TaxID=3416081 RepID=UPI003CFB3239